MLRRSFLLALLVLPAGCAVPGLGGEDDQARPIGRLSRAIGRLDDARARLPADRQPEVARVVARLRLTLDHLERVTHALAGSAPADLPAQVDALTASADRLGQAAASVRHERLQRLIEDVGARADAISGALRTAVADVRPALRPAGLTGERLAGSAPSGGAIAAVRVAGVIYAMATVRGLAGALTSSDPPARTRRSASGAAYGALLALALIAATFGARPVASMVSPQISMPASEQACHVAAARGEQLVDLLRPAVELELQASAGPRDARADALTRTELVEFARGGNQRRLLDRESHAARPARPSAPPSDRQIASETLARNVRELAAECVSFAATSEAAEDARFHHTLATEYLGSPTSPAEAGRVSSTPSGARLDPASARGFTPPGG